jgi:hypothetical protein
MDAWRNGTEWILLSLVVSAVGCGGTSTGPSTNLGATSEDDLADDVVVRADDLLMANCSDCGRHASERRRAVRGVLPGSADATCLYGTSDVRGDVALGFGDLNATWNVYDDDGVPLATIASSDLQPLEDDAYPLVSGFQIPFMRTPGQHSQYFIGTWAPDGAESGELSYAGANQFLADLERSPIPGGGVFTSQVQVFPDGTRLEIILHWIGADAHLLGETSFILPAWVKAQSSGAVDTRAHTLTVFPSAVGFDAQWFDSDGSARGVSFPSPLPDDAQLSPLIGGGFAVRAGDDWVGVIGSDETQLAPAPPWLAARPHTQLVILGRGSRYALLSNDGETPPPLPQVIELRSAKGAWLGDVVASTPHGRFQGQRTRIGADGTIVQLLTEAEAAATQCVYRFWPHILR